MKTKIVLFAAVASFAVCLFAKPTAPVGTAFTYQGSLNNGGVPAHGLYDFQFMLSNSIAGQIGVTVTNLGVGVTNGLFLTAIDFGPGTFTGEETALWISVRTNGNGAFVTLTPPQEITPTPNAFYSVTSDTLTGPLPAGQFAGTYPNPVMLTNAGNILNGTHAGTFSGNGSGLTNLPTEGGYLYAYSTSPRTGTGLTYIIFDTIGAASGWTVAGDTFAAANTGVYRVQYQAQLGSGTGNLLLSYNGLILVPGTQLAAFTGPANINQTLILTVTNGDFIGVASASIPGPSTMVLSNASMTITRLK